MANFDLIGTAASAYKKSWEARHYLLRLAAVPIALKIICFTIASLYADDSYLLFMLILVPALIAEGWMLAHFIRFLVLGQTWPFRPTGDMEADHAALSLRARGVLSGMIVFVLINMAIGFLSHFVTVVMGPYMPVNGEPVENIPAIIPLLSFGLLGFMFWAFRLLWLHIPFSLNMDLRQFIGTVRGASLTVRLIALWLMCFVPFLLAFQMFAPVLQSLPEDLGRFGITIVSILVDTLKSIVTVAGMTYAFREIFAGRGRMDRRV